MCRDVAWVRPEGLHTNFDCLLLHVLALDIVSVCCDRNRDTRPYHVH